MQITDYIPECFLIVVLVGIIVIGSLIIGINRRDEDKSDCIFLDDSVYFHTDNATFNITGALFFHDITRTNDYMEFNNTKFYVDATDVNITLDYLVSNTTLLEYRKIVSFYTDHSVWFNITGFSPNTVYFVYRNSTLLVKLSSDVAGTINFQVTDTNEKYIEIHYSKCWEQIEQGYLVFSTTPKAWQQLDNGYLVFVTRPTTRIWNQTNLGYLTFTTSSRSWNQLDKGYLVFNVTSRTWNQLDEGYLTFSTLSKHWEQTDTGYLTFKLTGPIWNQTHLGYLTFSTAHQREWNQLNKSYLRFDTRIVIVEGVPVISIPRPPIVIRRVSGGEERNLLFVLAMISVTFILLFLVNKGKEVQKKQTRITKARVTKKRVKFGLPELKKFKARGRNIRLKSFGKKTKTHKAKGRNFMFEDKRR